MRIIDGNEVARKISDEIKREVAALDFKPVFCDVLVGEDAASRQYVDMKAKAALNLGFEFRPANYAPGIATAQLIAEIKKISQEPNMCGMIVQLPLPGSLDRQAVLDAIDPKIDVDCTGKINSELFYSGKANMVFPTAAAIMELLDGTKADFNNKKFLVIGFGQLVGRPINFLLKQRGFNVEVADSRTENILPLMKNADVIISAAGKANLITGDKIKPGCIIIDAGTSELDGGIVGDVDLESVKNIAGMVSPVPGGVGPVTVAKLLYNVLRVAKELGIRN
jgi:methylenetetrahydrofolate dehydrogenase (NADP+)/methenyltetrahydrofolate cyclohydrolase